jgi:hypothetical protein
VNGAARRTAGVVLVSLVAAVSAALVGPGGTAAAADPAAGTTARDVYRQPFAWDSIWNLPLSTTAQYHPFDAKVGSIYADVENISVDPAAPVKQLKADPGGAVHVDPALKADGSWNNCSTLLMDTPDKRTVIQGQPMVLSPGGSPRWSVGWKPESLTGPGVVGCHGGSGMSGIGGTIRQGELRGGQPLRHALKVSLPCTTSCSSEHNGFRWPAVKADKGYQGKYGGKYPEVNMGALLALPPDFDTSTISAPDVRRVAEALKTYGAYVVDETGGSPDGSFDVQSSALGEFPGIDSTQMRSIFNKLDVVANNAPATPGGGPLGSPRRAPCAGPFTDGTGGAPPSC